MTRRTSKAGEELIKLFEGFKNKVYKCPAGLNTIGYGHVIVGEASLNRFLKTGITEEEATCLLRGDISIAEEAVERLITTQLNQNQFDAMVSLIFNIGATKFRGSKGHKALNLNGFELAKIEMFDKDKGWVRANGKILKGLVNRRQAELKLFNAN